MPWSRALSFSDPFPFQAALLSVVQAEILPTARGSFHFGLTQIGMNKLRMQRFDVVLPQISTVELASDRKVIGFLVEPGSSYPHHCGMEVTPDDIFVYGYDVLHQRSGSDYHIGTMSLPMKDFPVLCKTIIGREFLEELRNAVVRPAPASMSRLRKLHNAAGQLAQNAPDLLEQPEVCRALEEQLIHAMVRCLAEGAGIELTTHGRHLNAIMVRFEEFLRVNSDRPLHLAEICAAIGVAERTLRAACEEHLGMGPIRFLTLRRMHLVRHGLLAADAKEANVTRIITDHGFWELGRFSVAYRSLFGESPSETLRRR
jgi:AraC-like DNA-binding protein